MRFTDTFIQRPVLATVINLLIIVLGIVAIAKLTLRQYPKMTNTTITITTAYPGASPSLVQGFITLPLEQSIASADGIDYLTAKSTLGVSTITAHIRLNYSPDAALTEITGKVSAVRYLLPRAAEAPSITKETGDTFPQLILSFTSNTMTPQQITAYLTNVIRPKLQGLGGISQVEVWGAKDYAMRIWLNPQRMAALNVSPNEISQALIANNVQAAPGRLKGHDDFINIDTNTDLRDTRSFQQLVIKKVDNHLIRLKDVAKVELAAKNYNSHVTYEGRPAIFIGVQTAPEANPLTVINRVIAYVPTLKREFPEGLRLNINYNATKFITASIHEVVDTILEAVIIVILVVFLFIGSPRAVLIPSVAIPLSLIGVCFFMLLMHFSLNLLTLLAMVLAIGLVVDDAIVVVENIFRQLQMGKSPTQAAIDGAREIAWPVVLMTFTLAAVFAPIGFIGGITGALFTEFSFTLAGAVIVSGIVALTFSPMLCSKILSQQVLEKPFVKRTERVFDRFKDFYLRHLQSSLDNRPAMLLIFIAVISSCYFLYAGTPQQLAPQEDKGFVGVFAMAPTQANLPYLQKYAGQLNHILRTFPQAQSYFAIEGFPAVNNLFAGMILKPWDQRKLTSMQIAPILQRKLGAITGLFARPFQPPPLPGIDSSGAPVQFVLTTTLSHRAMYEVVQTLLKKINQSGKFMFAMSDLHFDQPQLDVQINREKAADLGISMQQIADGLATLYGSNFVNRFNLLGYSYEVITQVAPKFRLAPKWLKEIYLRTAYHTLVPLSTFVNLKQTTQPATLNQFQQLNAVTIGAVPLPGMTQGQALHFMQQTAKQILPRGISYDYAGQSRQFMQEGNTLIYAFMLAGVLIFLLLSAQFESFRDSLIILLAVPLSTFGALLPLYLGAATLNIYTKIGLIALIGLIAKHGILLVEFANNAQREGATVRQAIEQAAGLRLRAILMTTASMVFGVLPLILAQGAGAVSRRDLGIVIACGMAIGTCFTLFVVPVMYTYLAKDLTRQPKLQQT